MAIIIIAVVLVLVGIEYVRMNYQEAQTATSSENNSQTQDTSSDYLGNGQEIFNHLENNVLQGTLEGQVNIGPICPVERVDNPCKPTPEMYAARKILVFSKDRSQLIQEVSLDSAGFYQTNLPPGDYLIDIKRAGLDFSSQVPKLITIESQQTVTLNISLDTGIR